MNILKKTYFLIFTISLSCSYLSQAQSTNPDAQQLRLHIKKNGKIQFLDFAITKTYFSKATDITIPKTGEAVKPEFEEKGVISNSYYDYTYFLIKKELIVAHSESADFSNQISGIYILSGFSFPTDISADAFIGQSIKTIENHPMFRKDPDIYRLMVTLIVPEKKKEPVALLESVNEADQQEIVEASLPESN